MSIYLRLDRAPEVCDFCRSQQRDQGIVWCPICGKIGSKDFVCCPIVEIPPHGRLIDADALFDFVLNIYKTAQGDARKAYRDVLDTIVAAGDVIPAEEGE